MPVKSAKEVFSAAEIREILDRNCRLYKNEPGFVEYFVALTTYLLEKHDGEKRVSPELPPVPPRSRAVASEESRRLLAADLGWRSKVESSRAGTPIGSLGPFIDPAALQTKKKDRDPAAAPEQESKRIPPADPPSSKRTLSPTAPGTVVPKPAISGLQQQVGKLQVYRSVSSFKSSTASEENVPCKVCGTLVPIAMKTCPGCGNQM